jgi:gliding motility-associated-like protein
MRNYLLIFLFLLASVARADSFVVTDPRDLTSAGTLRWALQMAKDNGNQPNWDTITFNIPSGIANARAIQLLSELPVVSSYLVIDGTTQSLGAPFGTSDAKIAILPKAYVDARRGMVLRNVDHVEIYGIFFGGFINNPPQNPETWRDGIFMWNVHDIVIGAPSKGNAFFGCYHSIRHEAIPEDSRDPIPTGTGYNIRIQNNEIGKNNTGMTQSRVGCVNAIELFDVYDITIGGYANREENRLMVFLNAIQISLQSTRNGNRGNVNIINNSFIIGTSTPALPIALPILGISVTDQLNAQGKHYVNISGNNFLTYTTGISLAGLKYPFSVVNNLIDCNRVNNVSGSSTAIAVANCDSGIIGGQDSANTIHATKNYGITMFGTKLIKISQNLIYCNPMGINIISPTTVLPKITDLFIDATGAAYGKTCANCVVEVFNTHQCANEYYNGETYLTNILADANGKFGYNGSSISCFNSSFTVTNPAKASAGFYVPYNFIFDTLAVIIQHASCGQNNGAIKNIKIFSGVDFHWEDIFGNTVGIDTNLVNVGPGFYKLAGNKQNLGCQLMAGYYEIKTVVPVINAANIILTNPVTQCNMPGSITGIAVTGGPAGTFIYKWVNQFGVTVGNSLNLVNVPAGMYTLTASISYNLACFTTAGPFVLVDKPAPVIDISGAIVNDASCGTNNGSISGIIINNATGVQQFTWKDLNGNTVGSTLNLLNVGAGSYQLLYDDASPCPPISSIIIKISNNGLVTINEVNKIIQPSGCSVIKGAITNMIVTGANLLQWQNSITGAVVGNALDLINVPSGTYRLKAFDTNFGCVVTSTDIFVPLATVSPLALLSKNSRDEFCSGRNGYIKDIVLSPSPAGYTFKWVKDITDTFAISLAINNLSFGAYELLGIDSNGCAQRIFVHNLQDHPSPQVNEGKLEIKDDECIQGIGGIKGIGINNGEAPFTYAWYAIPAKSTGINSIDLLKTGAGNYYLVVADKNGCKDTSTVITINNTSPFIPPAVYGPVFAKRGGTAFLNNLNGIPGNYEIFNDPASTVSIETNYNGSFRTPRLMQDKDYWVEHVVGSCRSARVKITVSVIDYSRVFVPNAFTPNNDSKNDVLKINVIGKIIINGFSIFNRFGNQVFFTSDINKGWDGTQNGKPLPTSAYTWIIRGYDIDGTPVNLRGNVLLVR